MTQNSTAVKHGRSSLHSRQLHLRPDLAAKRNVDVQRISDLALISHAAAATEDIRMVLPDAGDVRMRKLVHRGTQRPVFKVSSVTLGRTVQCESLLEVDEALVLDADPRIPLYAEQPARILYLADGEWYSHIPDFYMRQGDKPTFIEVKFAKDVDGDVRARTALLAGRLARLGVGYALLTEHEIRDGVRVDNAIRLLRRARVVVDDAHQLIVLQRLRSREPQTLREFGWGAQGSIDATCVAKLVLLGVAALPDDEVISASTRVWLVDEDVTGEARHVGR